MRLDKWLWAARFFKTRALAAKACELGRVECHSVKAKPAKEIKAGDLLRIKNEAGVFVVEVLGLAEMRGPAAVAQGLYRETAESLELRKAAAEERKAGIGIEGRPSKKDRRERERFLGRGGRDYETECVKVLDWLGLEASRQAWRPILPGDLVGLGRGRCDWADGSIANSVWFGFWAWLGLTWWEFSKILVSAFSASWGWAGLGV